MSDLITNSHANKYFAVLSIYGHLYFSPLKKLSQYSKEYSKLITFRKSNK